MSRYRTFTEVEESYFRDHPEEMDDYIMILFEEYARDGNTGALLSSLRAFGRVKGLSKLAVGALPRGRPNEKEAAKKKKCLSPL